MSAAKKGHVLVSRAAVTKTTNKPADASLLGIPGGKLPHSHLLFAPSFDETELRNRIYSYVLDRSVMVVLSKDNDPLRFTIDHDESPPIHWSQLQRKAYGLTQVCRQIREEFSPIHRRKTTVTLRFSDLIAYTSTAFPDSTRAEGSLIIVIPHNRIENDCIDYAATLLRLGQDAPNLEIRTHIQRVGERSAAYQEIFSDFFNVKINEKGLARAVEIFEEMTIVTGRRISVQFETYASFSKSWMPYFYKEHPFRAAARKELRELMQSIGLELGLFSLEIFGEESGASEGEECRHAPSSYMLADYKRRGMSRRRS